MPVLRSHRARCVGNRLWPRLYSPLTEDEEEDIGGDAAEFSYLVRVADAALEPQKVGDA